MKMSFPIGGDSAAHAPIDYRTFVAGIVGRQSASHTAAIAARLPAAGPALAIVEALARLILGDRERSDAVSLKGSFHPVTAMALDGKAGSTNMKPAFTFAFQRSFNALDVMTDPVGGAEARQNRVSRYK